MRPSQKDKTQHVGFHFYEVSKVVKLIKTESRNGGYWRGRVKELFFNGFNVSGLTDKVLEICFTTMRMYLTLLIVHLNMVKMVTAF